MKREATRSISTSHWMGYLSIEGLPPPPLLPPALNSLVLIYTLGWKEPLWWRGSAQHTLIRTIAMSSSRARIPCAGKQTNHDVTMPPQTYQLLIRPQSLLEVIAHKIRKGGLIRLLIKKGLFMMRMQILPPLSRETHLTICPGFSRLSLRQSRLVDFMLDFMKVHVQVVIFKNDSEGNTVLNLTFIQKRLFHCI